MLARVILPVLPPLNSIGAAPNVPLWNLFQQFGVVKVNIRPVLADIVGSLAQVAAKFVDKKLKIGDHSRHNRVKGDETIPDTSTVRLRFQHEANGYGRTRPVPLASC